MASDEQKRSGEIDEKTTSPPEPSSTAEPHAQPQKFWRTFLKKMAIAARLFGKGLYRLRLNRLDLARVDRRLGAKAYATGTAEGQAEFVSKLERVTGRVTQLRAKDTERPSTFSGKAKALVSATAKAAQIAVLQVKRRRVLRQLGAAVRQSGVNSSDEARSASAVADRVGTLEAEMRELAPQTYPWVRRPLLLACLLMLLAAIGGGFAIRHQSTAGLAQQRGAATSGLSDAQMKKMLASQQSFQQQMQQMVADATRRETEERQARIAAAERQYGEQRERERGEVEKRQREVAAEQERVTAAERARQEAQQREEERRVADDKARQEQQRQWEAQEQHAKAEAVARAEQQSKQEVRRVAQAFVQALERNDMRSASSLAGGDEKQLALAKAQHDFARSFVRMQLARAKKFGGNQGITLFDPSWRKAEEHVEGEKATVNNGLISCKLAKNGETWKVHLPESSGSNLVRVVSSLIHDIDEITSKIEKGDYKKDKEAEDAFEAKLAAVTSSDQASLSAGGSGSSRPRSEDSLAVERWLRSRLAGGMTERQIVEVSDLIAAKFASADISQLRGRCFKGSGDQRQFDREMLYAISKGEYVPSAQSQAKGLREEIEQMFPPRAVFETSLLQLKAKALPPIEEPIHQGPKPTGSLVKEQLLTFDNAMLRLADAYLSQRPHTGKSRLSYYSDVKSLQAGDVLYCCYESGDNFFHERPYFYWYREIPPSLEDLLRTLPTDHPIRQIGPPLEEAPPTLELAMKTNVATAEDVKKMMTESRARAEKQRGSQLTGREALSVVGLALVGVFALSEAMHQHNESTGKGGGELFWESCSCCWGSRRVDTDNPASLDNTTDALTGRVTKQCSCCKGQGGYWVRR